MILFLSVALFADALRVLNYFYKIFPVWVIDNYSQVKTYYFIFVLFASFVITYIGFRQYSKPQLKDLNLSINSNKGQLDNLKIIAASDLHLGMIIQKSRLAEWIAMINKQDPDIILLVGDIFDRSLKPYDSQGLIDELKNLKSKYGVFAVLGNHDYYAKVDRSVDYLRRSGIKLLRDQSVIVDNRLMLIGRDDGTNRKRKPLKSLMSEIDPSFPVILMVHQPTRLHESAKYNIDLQISGHTHNGQIFPGNLLAPRIWELSYGYREIDGTNFYVSSGLGLTYIPIRIGTRSEIVRIHLRSENQVTSSSKFQ
ncbi:MAG: metallophosphoesterase [Bacteroidales bacterium]